MDPNVAQGGGAKVAPYVRKTLVKFFRHKRRVLVVTTLKNPGTIVVEAVKVFVNKDERTVTAKKHRVIPLGSSKFSLLLLLFRFTARDGADRDDEEEKEIRGISARIELTIKNDPSEVSEPDETVVIAEEEADSQPEDDETPDI